MSGLEEFLEGSEQPVAAVEPAAEPETQAAEAPATEAVAVRDEKGRFAPKGEEATPPVAEEQHSIPPKALQEERRKRQELEARIAEYEARLATPPQPAPDLWEDTQGWQQHFGQEVVQTAVSAASTNASLNMSEMLARDKFDDFDDVKAKFLELAQANPTIIEEAKADPHPWRKAYQIAKNHERMTALSAVDVTDMEAKLREQIRAELTAELKTAAPSIPDTLADAQSARSSSAAYTPPSLDDVLRR